jgi:hypothetical protein
MEQNILDWLLQQDPSIQYRVHRDFLQSRPDVLNAVQEKIRHEGWGKRLMDCQQPNGEWGEGYYRPKWTSTHYTLLLLKCIGFPQDEPRIQSSVKWVLDHLIAKDGGIGTMPHEKRSDCCITGMFLNFASYFHAEEEKLKPVIDHLLDQHLPDGGFNCRHPKIKVHHSSFHTTLSVIEGYWEYERQGYRYRIDDIRAQRRSADEFLLQHRLFLSDKDGRIIDPHFLSMHWPTHWHYDVLRALEYFTDSGSPYDLRFGEALSWLKGLENQGKWPLSPPYPNKIHFLMERTSKSSAINTARTLRIFEHFMKVE